LSLGDLHVSSKGAKAYYLPGGPSKPLRDTKVQFTFK
jgi:hypothetical protein